MGQIEARLAYEAPYFYSPYKESCDLQFYGPDALGKSGVLTRIDSLRRNKVLRGMIPNALYVHDQYGNLWENHPYGNLPIDDEGNVLDGGNRTTQLFLSRNGVDIAYGTAVKTDDGTWKLDTDTFDQKAVSFVEGGYIVPASPWGRKFDIMYMDLSATPHYSLVDQQPSRLAETMDIQSKIIEERLRITKGKPVYWGVNNSSGLRSGKGLMSVLYPHEHIWQFNNELSWLRPAHIRNIRNLVRWDDGISHRIGEQIKADIERNFLHQYWGIAQVDVDNMGLTINLAGFKPEYMRQRDSKFEDPKFIKEFWRPLSHTIHNHLVQFHQRYFGSDLNEYNKKVLTNHVEGDSDTQQYSPEELDAYLTPLEQSMVISDEKEKKAVFDLMDKNKLHKPPGWSGGIQFTNEGAFVTVSLGFLDEEMGPAQGMGIDLTRNKTGKLALDEEGQIVRKMQVLKKSLNLNLN